MENEDELPASFGIEYLRPGFNKYISFKVYKEPKQLSWNGYYKGYRVRIWFTGDCWIVAGYTYGIEACYFRITKEESNLKKISKLVQCACFFIDTNSIIEEEDKNK